MSRFKLLAIETATAACSIALGVDGNVGERHEILALRDHSQRVLVSIEALLKEASMDLADLDAIAYGKGPGSFTGIRLAATIAQGLALGVGKPLVEISTLQTMAQTAYVTVGVAKVFAHVEIQKNSYYAGFFELDSDGMMQLRGEEQEQVQTGEQVSAIRQSGKWYAEPIYPRARDLLALAQGLFAAGKITAPLHLSPTYPMPAYVLQKV